MVRIRTLKHRKKHAQQLFPVIAVIIPAYKVEKHIARVIENIPDFVKKIIVVNDASPDRTGEVLRSLRNPRLIIVTHEENQGVGGAMISGYNRAVDEGAEIMVKMDGDDQMFPEKIRDLIKPIIDHHADFTKGNRFLNQTQLKKMPAIRRLGNWGLTFLVKAASGYWRLFDPSNGFTAMHASVWRMVDQEHISRDYFFESSLLIELHFHNAVIRDIPIPARYQDEESSLSVMRVLFSFPWRLVKAFFRRIRYQYYLYDFSFVSVAFLLGFLSVLFGFVWGIWKWIISYQSGIPATTGTVLIAVLPIILGVQLFLQAVSVDMSSTPEEPVHKEKDLENRLK